MMMPVLMKAADGLTVVPMLCILMINARQRATQLNPATGDPQAWAQFCMYICVASLVLRLILAMVEDSTGSGAALKGMKGNKSQNGEFTTGDKVILAFYVLASIAMYGSCVAIVISVLVMERTEPIPMEAPPLTPMMLCSLVLTVLYLVQYLILEVCGCGNGEKSAMIEQESTSSLLRSHGDTPVNNGHSTERPEVEPVLKIEPVTLQFTPMFCVLLVGISMRAVQLNLQPPQWARVAMFLTSFAMVLQAILVPILEHIEKESSADIGDVEGMEESKDQRKLPLKVCTIAWSLLLACLYLGIFATLVSVFAMEAEPLDAVWPKKQIGMLEEFLRHLEKSRHLMENEALRALSTAAVPPISSAMRCTMLLTLLYFGLFLVLIICRVTCGPARLRAAEAHEAYLELIAAETELRDENLKKNAREANNPERGDVVMNEERIAELERKKAEARRKLIDSRAEILKAQASEAHIREGVQRSLAFVPMLCVIMIGVRMRAMQVHIRDPQPWAQWTMIVATAAVSTNVVASTVWACSVQMLPSSGGELGVKAKVMALTLLGMRYVAAIVLYIAMIALVVALVIM
jgi:hypothetical protein